MSKKLLSIFGTLLICLFVLTSCQGDTANSDGSVTDGKTVEQTNSQENRQRRKKKNGTVLTDSKIGEEDGYSYELWKDSGDTTMTLTGDGCFDCEWKNINNALFRIGKKFDCTKTYEEIGNIELEYDVDYNPDGNSYLCLYGWTREPLIEYYVVESWGSWRPPGGEPIATVDVDGRTYDVYRTLRVNQPSIDGNTTFEQYWSVRREKSTSGTVNATAHFMTWEALGMPLGKLYEAALTVEGYQSAGSAEVYKNELSVGGKLPDIDLPEPPPPDETDADGFYFHSLFESQNDGWSSRGGAGVKTVSDNAFEGEKSLEISGRNQSWQGAEHPLSTNTYIPGQAFAFSVMAMQNSVDSADFKLTLQYSSPSGTNYDCIAEVSAEKGEWVRLENASFEIPKDAWNLVLYVETAEGTFNFYIDDATAAPEGVLPKTVTDEPAA